MRPWIKKLLVALAAPLLFLLLLEVVLSAAGVQVPRFDGLGDHDSYWLPFEEQGQPAGWVRAFPRKNKKFIEPAPLFLRDKPANGWRVFVLGESTVQGFPYEIGSFSDWMRLRAAAMLPDRAVEVVNCGNAGWHASDLRLLLQDCLEHEPDLLVWMVGHNEFHPHNVATLRHEFEHPLLHRARTAIFSLHTAEWLGRMLPDLRRRREGLTDHARREERPSFGVELPLIKERFRQMTAGAVADAREAGVPIVMCTMPRNVRKWPPNGSYFSAATRQDPALRARWDEAYEAALAALDARDAATALALLGQARAIDATPAKLHFARGRALERLARRDEARAAFFEALELDAHPNRAHQWEETVIRTVADETKTPLVDLEALFDEAAPMGLTGDELIPDNVHPSLRGHEIIASAVLDVIERELGVPFDRGRDVSPEQGRDQLGVTAQNHLLNLQAECLNITRLVLQAGTVTEAWTKARAMCLELLAADSTNWEVLGTLGLLEAVAGNQAQAKAMIERAMSNNVAVKLNYLVYWKTLEPYQRAIAAAGLDMAAVEASLSPEGRVVVDNRVWRAAQR